MNGRGILLGKTRGVHVGVILGFGPEVGGFVYTKTLKSPSSVEGRDTDGD